MARRAERIGGWRSPKGRQKFLDLYARMCAERWPEPPTELDVDTPAGSTHIFHWPGDGAPIVFLHGFGATSLMWCPYVAGLRGHALYLVDSVGDAGRSVQRSPIRDGSDLAVWLDDVLGGLNIESAHLVGSSYGGWQALNQAIRSPRRVASITLLDPAALAKLSVRFWLWSAVCGVAMLLPARLRRRAARALRQSTLNDKEFLRLARYGYTRHRYRLPMFPVLTDAELQSISVPTLLVLGGKSEGHRAEAVRTRAEAHIPNLIVDVIPDAGHSLPVDHAQAVTERVHAYLQDTSARRSSSHLGVRPPRRPKSRAREPRDGLPD